jgi:hypothetical protein
LIQAGSLGLIKGAQLNPYPAPGTAGEPNSTSNFQQVKAAR